MTEWACYKQPLEVEGPCWNDVADKEVYTAQNSIPTRTDRE